MNTERMSLQGRALRHAALGDVARLAVVDELMLGDRSPTELQALLGLPSNLMAHHLKVLEDAGLVARRRSEGDRRRTYLTLLDSSAGGRGEQIGVGRVLFVCSANSARSQLAAALWARSSEIPVVSAGTSPASKIADGARRIAARRGLDLRAAAPQSFVDVVDDRDFVVAVCDNAYEELADAVGAHWSVPDPVRHGGARAFDDTYGELERRIQTLTPQLIAS